jgi:pyruvate kinase
VTAEAFDRRAKIMATLGPASRSEEAIAALLEAGVDIVRLNLSHGAHGEHRELIRTVRRVAAGQGRHVPVVLDLMGPRYRLGELPSPRTLEKGEVLRLGPPQTAVDLPLDPSILSHLRPGERLLVDNGLVELAVTSVEPAAVAARVVAGGRVSSRKGINLPDSDLPFEISAKDARDIRFAVAEGADLLAASYVGSAQDLEALRTEVRAAGGHLPLVAKLERKRAVERLAEITAAADALMVARGDLGVEVPLSQVPVLQKQIIAAGRQHGKPVIVATQMLESMIEQPRPTRAEATDVANAVFDGADALMLSGETAAGRFPVEAVRTMATVIAEAERYQREDPRALPILFPLKEAHADEPPVGAGERSTAPASVPAFELADAVSAAAVHATGRIPVRFIVAFSQGGFTARLIARYRPAVPILVFTPDEAVARQIQILWGVRPLVTGTEVGDPDEVVQVVERKLRDRGLVSPGDVLVILMGAPMAHRPLTNLLRLHAIEP